MPQASKPSYIEKLHFPPKEENIRKIQMPQVNPNLQHVKPNSLPHHQGRDPRKGPRKAAAPAPKTSIVDWGPNDPDDPLNWRLSLKMLTMALVATMAMVG